MPILNYTTKIDADQTAGEIRIILRRHKAKKILEEYDEKDRLAALSFIIDTPTGEKGIRLPANVKGVVEALRKENVLKDYDHAERVAWRIIKDWTEAQMAIIDAGMASMEEVFFPYLLGPDNKTLFEQYQERQALLAGSDKLA